MLRAAALAGLTAFLAITIAEHALEPQLVPARHTISEYVNTGTGALMTAAFLAWAGSLLATAALAWRDRRPGERAAAPAALAALLAIASAGLVLTACFATQTSAGVLPPGTELTASGRIHDLASATAQEAMLIAALVTIARFWRRRAVRVLVAALLAVAVVSSAILLAIGDPVDGVRQRILVGVGCAWQATLVAALARTSGPPRRRVSGT